MKVCHVGRFKEEREKTCMKCYVVHLHWSMLYNIDIPIVHKWCLYISYNIKNTPHEKLTISESKLIHEEEVSHMFKGQNVNNFVK